MCDGLTDISLFGIYGTEGAAVSDDKIVSGVSLILLIYRRKKHGSKSCN